LGVLVFRNIHHRLRIYPRDGCLDVVARRDHVVVAHGGSEALDFLFGTGAYRGRDLSIMPQVTLLDLKLPRVDGLEVLRRLRANDSTRRLPVVVLTSSNEEPDQIGAYGLGANSYPCKPVDFTEFGNRPAARTLLADFKPACAERYGALKITPAPAFKCRT
jgi:CheY-like chemotaxis protein